MPSSAPVVAILNTNDDVVELLRAGVELAGFIAVSIHVDSIRRGKASLDDFVREHEPSVIIYDIAPPYEQSWRYFRRLRESPLLRTRQFVITSTNAKRAAELADNAPGDIFEIIGKPYDIDRIVDAVRQAARARPTRD